MTPFFIEDDLNEELKAEFTGFKLKNTDEELVPFNFYPQNLPAKKEKGDKAHFPYMVTAIVDGEDPNEEDPHRCRVVTTIGIYDKDENYQGHKDLLNVLQKVYCFLKKNPVIKGKYELQFPISWSIYEENNKTFPFYFAAIETNWTVGKITPADTFI